MVILNEKHGLNPTIAQCVICGGEKNEIALLGNAMEEQAPMKMVVNNEPCDGCKKMMKVGILIISVRDGSDKKNPYRTGLKAAITEEAFERIFGEIPKNRCAFIEDDALKKTGIFDLIKAHAQEEIQDEHEKSKKNNE